MDQKKVRSGGREAFVSERQLARLTASWPTARLEGMSNGLPGVKPVDRFTDRKTAVRRIWKAVRKVESSRTQAVPSGLQRRSPCRPTSNSLAPDGSARSTKADHIIGLLKRPSGATLESIMAVTGWQAHSVRGFVSYASEWVSRSNRSSARMIEFIPSVAEADQLVENQADTAFAQVHLQAGLAYAECSDTAQSLRPL
jgi:hypothetical protein